MKIICEQITENDLEVFTQNLTWKERAQLLLKNERNLLHDLEYIAQKLACFLWEMQQLEDVEMSSKYLQK